MSLRDEGEAGHCPSGWSPGVDTLSLSTAAGLEFAIHPHLVIILPGLKRQLVWRV
jgi:hypothetical protein